ncbi:MAG: DUF1851 domain-containing protein [Microscillaceae bacterium]|nr:DUF1851 domain-containing protein [Microscillaceae bacterium]
MKLLEDFLEYYPPTAIHGQADELMLQQYRGYIPDLLLELWTNVGFGKYADGLIEIVDPEDFRHTLQYWLSKRNPLYFPIAISGFGDLFYYRKLGDKAEDVCMLDVHYRQVEVCTWSLKSFFNQHIAHEDFMIDTLRSDLFNESRASLGELEKNEIFYFVPALILGGKISNSNIEKGNAQVHLHLLYQMGLNN